MINPNDAALNHDRADQGSRLNEDLGRSRTPEQRKLDHGEGEMEAGVGLQAIDEPFGRARDAVADDEDDDTAAGEIQADGVYATHDVTAAAAATRRIAF